MRIFIVIMILFYSRFLAAGMPPRLESLHKNIVKESMRYNFNPSLVAAMIFQESGGKLDAHEYSKGYPYFYKPAFYAEMQGIPLETEMEAQRSSYGLMQIKCSTARYIGFSRPCQNLYNAATNLAFGVKYMSILKRRYKSDTDMISSYNQGQPFKFKNGQYRNYRYVRNVLILEKRFQQWFPKPKPSVTELAVIDFEISRLSFLPVVATNI
jgi:hypothetical protein